MDTGAARVAEIDRLRILLAEDDPIGRAVLEAELRRLGHECVAVDTGLEAWRVLGFSDIRVVISDWSMPGLDGLELCRRIRMRRGEYVYFILISVTNPSDENEVAAANAGVDDFLAKPVSTHELRLRLRVAERILSFTRQVRELEAILPICGYCKKVRDDRNYWNQIEHYIGERTGTAFSHSVCPDCMMRHVKPQLDALSDERPKPRVDRVE